MDIELPKPVLTGTLSLEEALMARRSVRHYASDPLTLEQLTQLLWAAQGETSGDGRRAAPSAHALYPLKLQVLATRVDGLDAGAYAVTPGVQGLQLLHHGDDYQSELQRACLDDQPWVGEAAAVIVILADAERMRRHFAEQPPHNRKGERYLYQELGALAQNVYLQSVSLRLGTVLVGGIDEVAASRALEIEAPWQVVAVMPVGLAPARAAVPK